MSLTTNTEILLLDIEGTTTAISFVHDTLFPYARENLETFLNEHWADAAVQADLEQVWRQARADREAGLNPPRIPDAGSIEKLQSAILANLHWQMDHDRKTTGLKALQGKIWRDAYRSGAIKGHVYDDVLPALQRWKTEQTPVYIYSSGSVEAQKLLFGHSVAGDLLPFLTGHYDTLIGSKKEALSYTNIAIDIGVDPAKISFVTDNIKEAVAAHEAGIHAILSVRPGTAPLPEAHTFPVVHSLAELF